MSFKLLTISLMYPGYLESFYYKYPSNKDLSYNEQYDNLLNESSEPIGSYTKIFNANGIEATCIITNADHLQKRWQLEHQIGPISNKQLVLEQVKSIMPDVLWIEGSEFIDREWVNLARRTVPGLKLVIGNHCAPYNESMLENFQNLDFIFTCTPGLKQELEKSDIKTFLIYHAFDPTVLYKIGDENTFPENELLFSGSLFMGGGFHDKRIELIESILKQNIDLKIYGNLEKNYKKQAKQLIYYIYKVLNCIGLRFVLKNVSLLKDRKEYGDKLVRNYSKRLTKSVKNPVYGIDMFRLLKKAKVLLNIHGAVAGDYAGNIRLFEATGVGTCLLTDNKKNIGDLFEINREIVVYDGIEDCIKKIKWLSENEDERRKIAMAGQRRTLTSHTIEDRCKSIIGIIRKELKS